ncbi:haloacid dehalogenase type II [Hymenobacter canadensis]|uniref:Haloacid dehalogenase type II n=1 Tax=Hymenobacter canadensis TaxID=2999067 RepID=A0ABY7LQE1_9BACT|nr:haloacid dehalogenase type II [Hymenobacter canadensis]WBA42635.1 haloacid dehalogenase type II [Hymenobacter canadensis]
MSTRRTFLSSLALAATAAALPSSLMAMPLAARPKLLLFDVNETLLDLSKLQMAINQEFKSEFAFKQWFSLLLQYSLVDTTTAAYHDFGQIGAAALDMLAQALGQPARPETRKKELLGLITELPPHPDVVPALTRLQKAGFRMATLTNSSGPAVKKQIAYAGLSSFFEQLLSVDAVQRYKPHPDTYRMACQTLKTAPADTLLIAAHGWDTAGAVRAGLQAAFVARPGQAQYPLAAAPAYTGPTIGDIARQLGA